jgi:hypothetical protein
MRHLSSRARQEAVARSRFLTRAARWENVPLTAVRLRSFSSFRIWKRLAEKVLSNGPGAPEKRRTAC